MEKDLGMLEMVLEERMRKMVFFQSYLDYKAQNAQMTNALGNGNVADTLDVFSKIPTVRWWKRVL